MRSPVMTVQSSQGHQPTGSKVAGRQSVGLVYPVLHCSAY